VREAKDGEMLKALNGQEYHLKDGMVVVADDRGVEAIGGIMGGSETAVDENTTNILLEAAIFDPISIATTGQRLNLVSDSRMRLERGVDTAVVKSFLDMATAMIVEHCGGTPATALLIGNQLKTQAAITLDHKQVEQRLGLAIEPNETVNILQRLGCSVEQGPTLKVTPPTWRHDLTIPEDLIEEIARLKGYSEIIAQSLPLKPVQNIISREEIARKHLSNRGFLETINWSFTDNRTAKQFTDAPENLVLLQNPISEDLSTMRPSALALLLKVAKSNTANARPNGSIFEVGSIYGEKLPNKQAMCITGLRFGDIHDRHWLSPLRSADVFDAKADTLSTLKTLGISESAVQLSAEGPSYYHPGRKGSFKQGNRVLAYFGELHPQISDELVCVGFEIFLDSMHAAKTKKVQATLADLMPVRRDFAFMLDVSIPAEKLVKAVEKSHDLIVQADVFDCYQGQHVEQGKKSLALSVTLQPTQKTLDEESLTQVHEAIVQAAAKIGAYLR
jgi:phenylalanyl-tRNA synthetase beta chain